MSVSLYAYTPEFCEGNDQCRGDCDLCPLREREVDDAEEDQH